jgi:hypothetical protein
MTPIELISSATDRLDTIEPEIQLMTAVEAFTSRTEHKHELSAKFRTFFVFTKLSILL